jgi:hypothetical protein
VTKAIAVLKKIQKLDPGRSTVDERLASLIDGGSSAAGGTWISTGPGPEIAILETHPNVRKILEEYFAQRADSSIEAAARGTGRA